MTDNPFKPLATARFGVDGDHDSPIRVDPTLAAILRRRTHRRFTGEAVSEELMQVLLACALSAPSKSDLQQASIVRVCDPEKRQAIAARIPRMPWVGTSPEFLVFCADHRRIRRITELRGHEFANDNLDGFLNATVDAALVMQTFLLSAESAGLGCCAISVIRDHIETVSDILELPDCVFPIAGLCVGHPAREGHLSLRLPPAVTVHVDRYDDSTLEAEVDAYDRRRDAIFSIPREQQKYTDRYGEVDDYTWSEDKARQESRPERQGFRAYLERRGFDLS